MGHRLVLTLVVLMTQLAGAAQPGVLRISVVITDAGGQQMPVPRYRLQISDNPASGLPRRVVTSLDGLVEVRLAPGNYTVESERPFTLADRALVWTQVVDIVAGTDHRLSLTAENANVVAPDEMSAPLEPDASSLLARWHESVVAVWTPTTRGTGAIVDARGLIATDHAVAAGATTVEVQFSATVKVAGAVIASDAVRGLSLIRVDPAHVGPVAAVPLACQTAPESLVVGQTVTAIEAPLGRLRGIRSGDIEGVQPFVVDTDLQSSPGATGGPVFGPEGRLVGLTKQRVERDGQWSGRLAIVRTGPLCALLASVQESLASTPPPVGTRLPVESSVPFPADGRMAGTTDVAPAAGLYRMSSSDFDIAFMTPVQLREPQVWSTGDARVLTEFGTWTEYVEVMPPVVFVRVTPKLTESFWMRFARGAARLQGASIPPIKRLKPDFASMRVFCGEEEITPVHPFRLEHRLSEQDTLVEGFYAFDPEALSPSCPAVTLHLSSEGNNRKAETVAVDPALIAQLRRDFGPHRAVK